MSRKPTSQSSGSGALQASDQAYSAQIMAGSENNTVNMMQSSGYGGNLVPTQMAFMAPPPQVMYPGVYNYPQPMAMGVGYPTNDNMHAVVQQEFPMHMQMGQMVQQQAIQSHMGVPNMSMPVPMGQPMSMQQMQQYHMPMNNMSGMPINPNMGNIHVMQGIQGSVQSMPHMQVSDMPQNMSGMLVSNMQPNMMGAPNMVVMPNMHGMPNMQGNVSNMQTMQSLQNNMNMQHNMQNMQGNRSQRVPNMAHQSQPSAQLPPAQTSHKGNHGDVVLMSPAVRTPQQIKQLQRKDSGQSGQAAQIQSPQFPPQSPPIQRQSPPDTSMKEARSKRKIRNIALPQKTTNDSHPADLNRRTEVDVRSPLTPNKSLAAGAEESQVVKTDLRSRDSAPSRISNTISDETSAVSSADDFQFKRKGMRITNSKIAGQQRKLSTQEESPANAATSSTAPAIEETPAPTRDLKTLEGVQPEVLASNATLPETGRKNRKLGNLKVTRDLQPIPAKSRAVADDQNESPTPGKADTSEEVSKESTQPIVASVSIPPPQATIPAVQTPTPAVQTPILAAQSPTVSADIHGLKKGRKGIMNLSMSKTGTVIAPIVVAPSPATGSDARPRDTVSKHEFLAYRLVDTTRPRKITTTRDVVVDEGPWRGRDSGMRDPPSRTGPRRGKVQPYLQSSDASWLVKQRQEVSDDERVVRQCRTILNKLSTDNFEKLFGQLTSGITKAEHIEALMKEVFEKATTQHGFIDLYTDLCRRLDDWCRNNPQIQADFRRILLAQCQNFFENNLKPPEGILGANVNDEEAFEREVKYKTAMLGNIKFVGRLLVTSLIASKILLQAAHQLLSIKTPITLECLCVLFMATGKAFDTESWKFHNNMKIIYQEARSLLSQQDTPARIRFLLTDVFDCQDRQWVDRPAM